MPKRPPAQHRPASPTRDILRRIGARLHTECSVTRSIAALILLVTFAFGSGLGHPLVFGDYALLSPARLASYGATLPTPASSWLSDASFGWLARAVGRDWSWHRALTLLLHATAVAFAFLVGRRLLRGERVGSVHADWIALLAAALFAVHPLAVHSVAYLSARPVVLQGMFTLVALWSVLKSTDDDAAGTIWLAPVAVLGALLASPAAAGLPVALAVVVLLFVPEPRRRVAWTAVATSALICVGWIAWAVPMAAGTGDALPAGLLPAVVDNASRWLRALGFGVAPVTAWIAVDMPEVEPVAPAWMAALSAVAFLGMIGSAWLLVRRPASRPLGAVLGLLAALACAEILLPRAGGPFTAWRAYPWLALLCLAVVGLLARLGARAYTVGVLALVACLVLGMQTLQTYATHVGLWDHAIRVAERSGPQAKDARLYVNRATLHRNEGHTLAAVADYGKALELQPDMPRALRGRAQAYIDDQRFVQARRDLERLLEVEPGQPVTHADLGLVLMHTGRLKEAVQQFDIAIGKGAKEPKVFLNRGLAMFELGGLGAAPQALDDIERALSLDPAYALAHFNRGLIFEQAAQAGMRLRDAVSPEIMGIVAKQNIARACQLGHRGACDLERERARRRPSVQEPADAPLRMTPEAFRERGMPLNR